jgi:hypothetical protein
MNKNKTNEIDDVLESITFMVLRDISSLYRAELIDSKTKNELITLFKEGIKQSNLKKFSDTLFNISFDLDIDQTAEVEDIYNLINNEIQKGEHNNNG